MRSPLASEMSSWWMGYAPASEISRWWTGTTLGVCSFDVENTVGYT